MPSRESRGRSRPAPRPRQRAVGGPSRRSPAGRSRRRRPGESAAARQPGSSMPPRRLRLSTASEIASKTFRPAASSSLRWTSAPMVTVGRGAGEGVGCATGTRPGRSTGGQDNEQRHEQRTGRVLMDHARLPVSLLSGHASPSRIIPHLATTYNRSGRPAKSYSKVSTCGGAPGHRARTFRYRRRARCSTSRPRRSKTTSRSCTT